MASRVIRKLRQLFDVDADAIADGETLVWDAGAEEFVPGTGGGGGGGAPTTSDYLVGTSQAGLSAEIVVGATPGGELGGSWGSPTVDATHSGSSHAAVQAAAEASAVILAPAASARNVIQPTAGSVIAAVVKAHAAQSVDLTQWQTSAGTVLSKIGPTGSWTIQPSSIGATGALLIDAGTPPSVIPNDPSRAVFNLKANTSLATDGFYYGVRFGSYRDSNFDHPTGGKYDWLFDSYEGDAPGGDSLPYLTVWKRRAADRKATGWATVNPDLLGLGTQNPDTEATQKAFFVGSTGLTMYDLDNFVIYDTLAGGVAHLAFQRVTAAWKFGVFGAAPAPVVQQAASDISGLWTALKAYGWLTSGSAAPDMATQTELDAHVNDASAAHAASAISYAGGTGMSATDVEAAVDELATEKADALVAVNTQTDSYTLALTDASKVVEMNKATANNLTVPLNSSVAFSVGTIIELHQYGAGQTTVVATGGVTIRSPGGKLKLTGQYSSASLRKRATDEWTLAGDIAA